MEGYYAAETLFQFDELDFNDNASNTMDNRKIVAGPEKEAGQHPLKDPDLVTPPPTIIAQKQRETTPNHTPNSTPNMNMGTPNNHIGTPSSTPNNHIGTPSSTPNNHIGTPITELEPEIKKKILEQVEFYFSDANVTKDKELAKQIRRNEMGYVSIKWITSFRKIQALTQDWKAVSRVLQQSGQLKVSTDKKMVRRKHPIPKKSDLFADKTVMASNLPLAERSVDSVKNYFAGFGRVTLVRFLAPGKPYPDDITSLHLAPWRGSPSVDMVAVEFDTVEGAELAVLKLSDSNNWRSSSQVQLLRTRQQKGVVGEKRDTKWGSSGGVVGEKRETKIRKSSEQCSLAHSLNHSAGVPRDNGYGVARSLPKQMFGMAINGTSPSGSSPLNSARRSHTSQEKSPQTYSNRRQTGGGGSYGDSYSCSPSANSYLGQRLAMEKSQSQSPASFLMVLSREPRGPDGSKGFGHRQHLN